MGKGRGGIMTRKDTHCDVSNGVGAEPKESKRTGLNIRSPIGIKIHKITRGLLSILQADKTTRRRRFYL